LPFQLSGGNVRDVFALRELEDVLLAVDDGQRAVGIPPTDVAGLEIAILGERGLAAYMRRKMMMMIRTTKKYMQQRIVSGAQTHVASSIL
jgi:hypothetical protein